MNKHGIIKSVSTLFPTRWHSTTKFGVNQILFSIVMSSFCGINRICRISCFTGDGLVMVLLKVNKDIDIFEFTHKTHGWSKPRILKAIRSVKEYAEVESFGEKSIVPVYQYSFYISNYDIDFAQLHEIYKQRSTSETWIEQVKGQTITFSTLTDDFWANDILWQLSVFACNLSVMMRQKKNRFKRQEHRTFIDWFISVPAKITGSGYQMEIKLYEHHFYKADRKELDRIIEAA